jgi:hypothetical protein
MKRALIMTTTFVTGFAMLAGTAMADQYGPRNGGPRGPMFPFADVDADGDGKVTQAEIDAYRTAKFAEADTDGNGSLSAEEMTAMQEARKAEREQQRTARMMERLDANKDGQISQDELPAPKGDKGKSFIERFDTDGDGAVSEEELAAAPMKRPGGDRKGGEHKGGDHKGGPKKWKQDQ